MYDQPVQIMGFYGLEGKSENTWVSAPAVLKTLKDEDPQLFTELVRKAPMTVGRVTRIYGFLTAPFDDFKQARLAHQKFQQIMRRDTHQLKLVLKPGDMYIWDNFRLLHGRERVLEVPRTGIGQTVPEQVVADLYRDIQIRHLKRYIDEKWLVHLPAQQLREMTKMIETGRTL
ncbi:hypothetical protein MMC26_001686 [Xylographa opegraphella]|nr:hypothetical protein [Xylographa opegraphella]